MKNRSLILLAAVLLVFAIVVSRTASKHSKIQEPVTAEEEIATPAAPMPVSEIAKSKSAPVEIRATVQNLKLPAASKSRPVALQSLVTMTSVMAKFSQASHSMDDLVTFLNDSKARPTVAKNVSPYIGEMDMIRTRSPLPGTRYFVAHYTGSGDERTLNQIEFDFEASPTALSEAKQSLRQAFQIAGAPKMQSDEQVVFDLGNGYLATARRMTWNDLKDSPTNAYNKKDVGTIRVSMQMDQEGDD